MAMTYERKNCHTKEVKRGSWEQLCELDKRIWSEPVEVNTIAGNTPNSKSQIAGRGIENESEMGEIENRA